MAYPGDLWQVGRKARPAADGTLLVDDDFLVLVNAWWEPLGFVLAETRPEAGWHVEVDTFGPAALDPGTLAGPDVAGRAGDKLTVGPRSVVVLRSLRPAGNQPSAYKGGPF